MCSSTIRVFAVVTFSASLVAQDSPITGIEAPSLAPFDAIMMRVMQNYSIPGGALAITQNGRLVYSRGYGWADRENREAMQPASLFRIAGISKSITAVAILRLVEQGRLTLDSKAFDILPEVYANGAMPIDSRVGSITVRQLLQHTAGWDRDITFDPMFRPLSVAGELQIPAPANCADVIRYMMRRQLDFDPGRGYSQSNFGYCILGRIIEKVTGKPYEEHVRAQVLAPLGIDAMRIGRTLLTDRLPGEVKYYDFPDSTFAQSVFPNVAGPLPWPYGSFYLEAMDSHDGWVGSAVDLIKFINGIDGRRGARFLTADSVRAMTARPPAPLPQDSSVWYGLGWNVRNAGNDQNWWHHGWLNGSQTLLVRTYHGFSWAVLFNSRPENPNTLANDLDQSFFGVLPSITGWPATDLLPPVGPPRPSITSVVNGASFLPGFSPGAWVTIRGANLSGTTRTWRNDEIVNGRLPVSIDNVRVTINGKAAAVYYVSPAQLNVQAPDETLFGDVNIQVTRDGVASETVRAELRRYAPALFTYSSAARTFAAAVHLDGAFAGDPAVGPGFRPARPGDRILLFGSGFGPAPAGTVIATASRLPDAAIVRVGGVAAQVEFAGIVGAGLVQFNVIVPEIPDGDREVRVEIAGVQTPASVMLHVKR